MSAIGCEPRLTCNAIMVRHASVAASAELNCMPGVHLRSINACPNVAGWVENHTHRPTSRNRAGSTRGGARTSSRAIQIAAGPCATSATVATDLSQIGASLDDGGKWFAICRRNRSSSGNGVIGRVNVSGGSFRSHSGILAAAAASTRERPSMTHASAAAGSSPARGDRQREQQRRKARGKVRHARVLHGQRADLSLNVRMISSQLTFGQRGACGLPTRGQQKR
jgi:hypothetical protein